jgi:heme oxygenase
MIMLALKEQTAALHHRLSANPYSTGILQGQTSLAHYRAFLERFYGFYAPVEACLAAEPSLAAADFDFEARRKAHLLAIDLRVLGATDDAIAGLPRCWNLPDTTGLARAVGTMYVLEGATLGGQIITRNLRELFGLDAGRGCAFFNSYGREVGPMWKAFGAFASTHADGPAFEALAIAAASETFEKMDAWLLGRAEGRGQRAG